MKKLNAKVKTEVWVRKVKKGALTILAGRRVMSQEDKHDLLLCVDLLEQTEGARFQWDTSLYKHAEQAPVGGLHNMPTFIQSQDNNVDLQDDVEQKHNEDTHDHNEPLLSDSSQRPDIIMYAYYLIRIETPPFWSIGRYVLSHYLTNACCEN
jgi:hypothetical protein